MRVLFLTMLLGTPALAAEIDLAGADADELYKCKRYPADARVRVTLKPDTTLTDLVTWTMGFTCKTFVYGQAVAQRKQTVTVITPSELSPRDAYRLFLLALHQMQLTVVPRGRSLEIVDELKARESPLPVGELGRAEDMGRILIRPTHLTIEELSPVLDALKSQFGVVTPLAAARVILVTDQGATIERMQEVLREIDQPRRGEGLWVVRLEHADAKEVATTLAELKRKMLVDARTNALVFAGTEAAWAETLALVRALDVELDGDAGGLHVYRLANARAEEVQKTLAAAGGQDTKVHADPGTNTLVIQSATKDFAALRPVLEELDRPRRQVYVEATILEVSVIKGRKLGVALHAPIPGGPDGTVSVISSQHADLGTTSKEATQSALVGAAAALFSTDETTFLGMSIPSFGALVHALQTDEDINVLSAPQIIAVDGREAEIKVGDRVPIPKSTISTPLSGSTVATQASVEYESVGLSLKLKPFINDRGQVQLDLEQTSNELGEQDPNGRGPTWQERLLKTSVIVEDQQPIVIGGLMIDRVGVSRSKVPLLGDIPVIGALFRWEQQNKKKRNLLVILTPYIVENAADAQRILQKKLQEREEFVHAFSSLEARELDRTVDYARKRGLVAEIEARVKAADVEAAALKQAEAPDGRGSVLRIGP
jgi:general secretion pathway protein D